MSCLKSFLNVRVIAALVHSKRVNEGVEIEVRGSEVVAGKERALHHSQMLFNRMIELFVVVCPCLNGGLVN